MASAPRREDLEPISPELVLVSPPDVARRARDELPDRPFSWNTTPVVRDRLPAPPAAVAAAPRTPARRPRRARIALAGAGIAAIAAAVGYLVASHGDKARRVDDPAAVTASGKAAAPTELTTTAQPQQTTTGRRAASQPRQHSTNAAGRTRRAPKRATPTATHAAKPKEAVRPQPTVKPKRAAKPETAVAQTTGFVPARTWTWPKAGGARGYEMEFLLNGHVVLRIRTTQPRLVLPRTFRFRAGTYHWIVQSIPPAANRRPIVDSKFRLTRTVANRANP
jgi:hypothetical protein